MLMVKQGSSGVLLKLHEYKGYMCNYIYKWHCGLQVCIPEYWMNEDELQILK